MVSIQPRQRDAVFRALADPTRRRILALLRVRPQAVGVIARRFPVSRPAISKHLRQLRSSGLIVTQRRGTSRYCSLNARPLRAVDEWLRDYQAYWSETLRNLKAHLENNS